MNTILCYGDSNTYGFDPVTGLRYPEGVRWTGRLRAMLGSDFRIIEEGCNGRTTVFDDPLEGWKNGLSYLRPCLNSHKPVDIVILMLGSNDLKRTFHADAKQIADGAAALVEVIREFTKEKQGFIPQIILVSPPAIGDGIGTSAFSVSFDEDAIRRSKEFPKYYRAMADAYDCIFLDAAKYARVSEADSLHLSPEGHAGLADALYRTIQTLTNDI